MLHHYYIMYEYSKISNTSMQMYDLKNLLKYLVQSHVDQYRHEW